MGRAGRGTGANDGTAVGPEGRQATDVHSVPNTNAASKTGRPDGVNGDRLDSAPEDPQRFTSGTEHENASEKAKARGADVIATGLNSEARAGFGQTDSVNHILPGDVPVEQTNDLIQSGGE